MITDEQMIFDAGRRWKQEDVVKNLICEIRLLHRELEGYRSLITQIQVVINDFIKKMRVKGGDKNDMGKTG